MITCPAIAASMKMYKATKPSFIHALPDCRRTDGPAAGVSAS